MPIRPLRIVILMTAMAYCFRMRTTSARQVMTFLRVSPVSRIHHCYMQVNTSTLPRRCTTTVPAGIIHTTADSTVWTITQAIPRTPSPCTNTSTAMPIPSTPSTVIQLTLVKQDHNLKQLYRPEICLNLFLRKIAQGVSFFRDKNL